MISRAGKKGSKGGGAASGLLSGVHPDSVEAVARIVEKAQAASDQWRVETTAFLDPALAADALMCLERAADVAAFPWGGHARAERVRIITGRPETLGEPWEEGGGDEALGDEALGDVLHASSSAPSFPETDEAVRAAIAALGGAATPKLTWSAPKDAVWMATGNTTMCRNPGEVLLLLKASDAIAFDLTEAYDCCADVTDERVASLSTDVSLHLRRWRDVRPALEFRLFVRDGDLVGMCQRDCSNFYPFLTERKQKDTLEETLVLFWQDVVSGAFECADCDSYAMDAYVTSANAVKIVDFNHWGGGTLPLMFTWAELEARRKKPVAFRNETTRSTRERETKDPGRLASGVEGNFSVPKEKGFVHDDFEFRVVATQGHIRPGAQLGVPFDMVDASPGGALAAFAERQREAQEKAFGAFARGEETRKST